MSPRLVPTTKIYLDHDEEEITIKARRAKKSTSRHKPNRSEQHLGDDQKKMKQMFDNK